MTISCALSAAEAPETSEAGFWWTKRCGPTHRSGLTALGVAFGRRCSGDTTPSGECSLKGFLDRQIGGKKAPACWLLRGTATFDAGFCVNVDEFLHVERLKNAQFANKHEDGVTLRTPSHKHSNTPTGARSFKRVKPEFHTAANALCGKTPI